MAHKIPICEIPLAPAAVRPERRGDTQRRCRRYTERRVFLRAAARQNADAARWLGAAMVLGGAMLAEFVHPHKQQK